MTIHNVSTIVRWMEPSEQHWMKMKPKDEDMKGNIDMMKILEFL